MKRPVPAPVDGIAEAYLALAVTLRQQDAPDYAMMLLRLSLDLRPDLTPARMLMADVLDEGKHPKAALDTLARVPPGDPLIAVVRLHQAALTDQLGHTDAAMRLLDQVAHDYPASPLPYVQQGDFLREKKRYLDAIAAYDKGLARIKTPRRDDWTIFYARGIAYERSHQWVKAEADFRHALALSPDQPFVLNYLGYSWTEQGRHLAEARRMIEQAVQQRPEDGEIIDSLGWVMLRQGDTADALRTLEKAVELDPVDPAVNGHLGDAYWAAGRKLEAGYQWRRALTLKPDSEDAARIEARLHEATAGDDRASAVDHTVR